MVSTYYGAPEHVVKNHIELCAANTVKPFEVIIVNDGFKTDLAPLLMPLSVLVDIVCADVLVDIPWNVSGATNLGIWLSKGDLISFEESDHIPEMGYYEEAIRVIGQGFDRFLAQYVTMNFHPLANYVVKRDVMADCGGLDEDFAGHYGNDDSCIECRVFREERYRTFKSDKRLITVDGSGMTTGVSRDSEFNANLMKSKMMTGSNKQNILRFPFTVRRFRAGQCLK